VGEREREREREREKTWNSLPGDARQFDLFAGFGEPGGQLGGRLLDAVAGPAAMTVQQRRQPAAGGRWPQSRRRWSDRRGIDVGIARNRRRRPIVTSYGRVQIVDGRVRRQGVETRQRLVDESQLTQNGASSRRGVVAVQLQQLRHGLVGQIAAKRRPSLKV